MKVFGLLSLSPIYNRFVVMVVHGPGVGDADGCGGGGGGSFSG